MKKAGVNACEKQPSEVQDRLETVVMQNSIGTCRFKVSIHEKSPGPTRTRRNTSLIDAIQSLSSEPLEKSRSGNSIKHKGGWAVNLKKEWPKDDYCCCCQLSIFVHRALIYHLLSEFKETVKKKIKILFTPVRGFFPKMYFVR